MSDPPDRERNERPGGRGGRLPVLCGADAELGNFLVGTGETRETCWEAAALLLREIDGVRQRPASGEAADEEKSDPRDWGRKFLASNGGSVYVDLGHLELCQPETRDAREHLACWHAMLRIARKALRAANARLPRGYRVHALVNNSDGRGHSWGSHLDFLVTRRTWENLLERRIHYGLVLASYQASSIAFAGQGKTGAENGKPWVPFQLSQRADFFETLIGSGTTAHRPLLNSRDEPLCGPWRHAPGPAGRMARLHVIFYDSNLSHAAHYLKVGVFQIVLAMLEAGRADLDLALEDPVGAVVRWSHDPGLQARARTLRGGDVTAVEHQLLVLERAARFVEERGCEGIVPGAAAIVDLWRDTLGKLRAGAVEDLAPRLDWALKYTLLRRAIERRPRLDWRSPEIRHLDHLYASLSEEDGLYWSCLRDGLTERIVEEDEIARLTAAPPETTRAWTRAMLLRRAGDAVDHVDWDEVRVRLPGNGSPGRLRTIELPDPLRLGRLEAEAAFWDSPSLDDLAETLAALTGSAPPDGDARSSDPPRSGGDRFFHRGWSARPPDESPDAPANGAERKEESIP